MACEKQLRIQELRMRNHQGNAFYLRETKQLSLPLDDAAKILLQGARIKNVVRMSRSAA